MKINITIKLIISTILFILLLSNTAIAELILCPDDITISCCQDYNNLEITGDPADNNSQFLYFTKVDSVGIDDCRVGLIKRTWTGHNLIGTPSCVQYITMQRDNQFNGDIDWPIDWSGHCGDDIPYTTPQYDVGFCDQIAHTFKDDTFRFVEDACVKILRNWKIIDWCIYSPNTNSTAGYWEYTQILMIVDNTAPEIQECSDKIIPALNNNCSANFTLTKDAIDNNCGHNSPLKWNFELDINNDRNIDTTGTIDGETAHLNLSNIPTGEHTIKWKVYDGCANISTCMEKIIVEDAKAPTPICYLSTTENLIQGDDSLRYPAKEFIKDAYDNCTAREDLIFSYSPDPKDSVKTFTCWDLGFQFFRIFAIDEAGNSDYALVLSRVNINTPCSNYPLVAGTITDLNNNPIKDIHIGLIGNGTQYLIDKTDNKGEFSFPYKESQVNAKLKFIVGKNYINNINEKDAGLVMDYLLGKKNLTETQKFAADLNNDGKVTIADMSIFKGLFQGTIKYEDIGNLAKFYTKDNTNPEGRYIEIKSIDKLTDNIEVKCVLKGDVLMK